MRKFTGEKTRRLFYISPVAKFSCRYEYITILEENLSQKFKVGLGIC